jgi:hypothetical protein
MSIIRAIKLLNPNAKVTVYNNDIDQIIWHEDTQPIEKNLILEKLKEFTNTEIVLKRLNEYGSPEQQIEFITENGLEAWQEKVKQIKLKYTK